MITATPRSRPAIPTSWTRGGIGVLVVFALAELLTRAELVTPTYLPPASSIVGETLGLFGRSEFWSALQSTMWATLLGMLRATLIAEIKVVVIVANSDRCVPARRRNRLEPIVLVLIGVDRPGGYATIEYLQVEFRPDVAA